MYTYSVLLNVLKHTLPTVLYTGPPSSVSDFYARRDCSYFFVSFSPATGDPVCGPVSHSFRVIPSDFEEFDIPRYELDRLSDTDYEISDVEPNNYTFSVIGLNNAGFGPIFNSMMFTVGGDFSVHVYYVYVCFVSSRVIATSQFSTL